MVLSAAGQWMLEGEYIELMMHMVYITRMLELSCRRSESLGYVFEDRALLLLIALLLFDQSPRFDDNRPTESPWFSCARPSSPISDCTKTRTRTSRPCHCALASLRPRPLRVHYRLDIRNAS